MASRGINKVILIGRVGQNPEYKSFGGSEGVSSFSLATSETWRDRNTGQMREKTEWHRISVFGQSATFCSNYVKKGVQVLLEGQLETRRWQDRDGQTRYSTEVVVRWPLGKIQFVGEADSKEIPVAPVDSNSFPPSRGEPTNTIVEATNPDDGNWDDLPF
jgi:single-strand DNA-binding protein